MGHAYGGEGEKEEGTGGGGGGNLFRRGINYSGILYPGDKLFRNRLSGGDNLYRDTGSQEQKVTPRKGISSWS